MSRVSSQQHEGGADLLKPNFQQFWILDVMISVLISKELILNLKVSHINSKKKKKRIKTTKKPQTENIKVGFIAWVWLILHSSLLSQNCWDWKGLWTSCNSSPLLRAGPTSPGFHGPCLTNLGFLHYLPKCFLLSTFLCKFSTAS